MIPWLHRLSVRAALATAGGAMAGALLAFMFVDGFRDADAIARNQWLAALALTAVGSAASASWWAARQARTLRGALQTASTALAGRPMGSRTSLNESAGVAQAVSALVDRAERSSRELSQRQAYAAVGDFATELARELAPSVQNARSAIRTLEGHLHIDSPFHAPLERAQRELHRVANTLQDSLRLARSGRLASQRLDLWIPLRAAVRTVISDAPSHRVNVLPPPLGLAPVWIHGDKDALEQLFLNLLLNGVQATAPGGSVTVDVDIAEDATVRITDSGCGIAEGALDHVFEPFYSTKPERAGLGLAIAWRTAAAHGGRMSIESASQRGTIVQVTFPIAEGNSVYALE